MKIILSRKGFDGTYGGYPSPIFPDGRMLSMPIPDSVFVKIDINDNLRSFVEARRGRCDLDKKGNLHIFSRVSKEDGRLLLACYSDDDSQKTLHKLIKDSNKYCRYEDLFPDMKFSGDKFDKVFSDLYNNNARTRLDSFCHLDPDIYDISKHENQKRICAFGQSNGVLTNLVKTHGVEESGLFLFYGTFQNVHKVNEKWAFDKNDTPKHIIYGYLEIKRLIEGSNFLNEAYLISQHPHFLYQDERNGIYIATDNLSTNKELKGSDYFNYDESLVLTKDRLSKSKWDLCPKVFKDKNVIISCHTNPNNYPWKEDTNKDIYFQSYSRFQEFVIEDNRDNPIVESWARNLITRNIQKKDNK